MTNPLPEITSTGLVAPGNPEDFEQDLVCNRKYAAVVSDFKPDFDFLQNGKLGWVVEDGIRDIGLAIAQARRLLFFTKGKLPQRTILMGRSQGSLIALRYAEERSPLVDGVVTACTVGAGASRSWDSAVDFALAVDVAFQHQGGWIWGASSGDVGKVRDDVVFAANDETPPGVEVAETLVWWLQSDPTAFARFEFVRLVTGMPLAGFYPFNPNDINENLPDVPGDPAFNWLGSAMIFATEVKADVESKAGGAIGQNKDHQYRIFDENGNGTNLDEIGYLNALLYPTGKTVEVLLSAMNDRTTYAGSPEGREYTAKYRDFSFDGLLPPHPMLSIHTTTDGLVLPSQETELRETLDATGRRVKMRQLRQAFVESNGHCTLNQAEWTRALEAMEKRLDTGVWPRDSFFEGAGLRFINNFDAGQFPQPPSP